MTFQASASLTFFTLSAGSDVFPDRLQVLVSLNGNSSNVGPPGSTSNFGDFTQKLIDINPTYSTTFAGGTNGYPSVGAHNPYVEYGPLALGQFAGDTGRIAFHYFLTDTSTQGSHIAIDDVSVNNIVVVPGAGLLAMRGEKNGFKVFAVKAGRVTATLPGFAPADRSEAGSPESDDDDTGLFSTSLSRNGQFVAVCS
jgi:hypothetical protein